MKEQVGNLWSPAYDDCWRGITTNGYVKKNGCCVMGRGVAAQAAVRYPGLPEELGAEIRKHGNVVHWFPTKKLFSFPVKHTWELPADLVLIACSVAVLTDYARANPTETFILPRPGCGNGQRTWAEIAPLCAGLPDNVIVIERI